MALETRWSFHFPLEHQHEHPWKEKLLREVETKEILFEYPGHLSQENKDGS